MVSIGLLLAGWLVEPPVRLVANLSGSGAPFERVNGLAAYGSKWVVGGMRGLFIGAPYKEWKMVSDRSVRKLYAADKEVWVVYGDGSVDKLDVGQDRLYYDVFAEAVRRPWASSITPAGREIIFGSSGGWFVREPGKPIRQTYPSALSGKEATFVLPKAGKTLVGTQDGLYVFGGSKVKRFGFGQGLSDTWMTSIAVDKGQTIVGTYTGGIYRFTGDKLESLPCPSRKVGHLLEWNGHLVLGARDGAWIRIGAGWQSLTKAETTFLSTSEHMLVVGTPTAVCEFQ